MGSLIKISLSNLASGKQLLWRLLSVLLRRPPGTWMRPEDVVDGLSGKFWAATT